MIILLTDDLLKNVINLMFFIYIMRMHINRAYILCIYILSTHCVDLTYWPCDISNNIHFGDSKTGWIHWIDLLVHHFLMGWIEILNLPLLVVPPRLASSNMLKNMVETGRLTRSAKLK